MLVYDEKYYIIETNVIDTNVIDWDLRNKNRTEYLLIARSLLLAEL